MSDEIVEKLKDIHTTLKYGFVCIMIGLICLAITIINIR